LKKSSLSFIWKHQKFQITQAILSKKINARVTTTSDFKLYYTAIATKAPWFWHKNRYEDQWNRIENPDMPTWFLKKLPKTCNGEKTVSSTNVVGKTWYLPTENWN
jgi:hypothetical protein